MNTLQDLASSQPPPTNTPAVGYFVDQKKGEVNELKQLLKNLNVEKDMRRKRDIIKKVIAYMTLGIDVSRLFTDMIMAIETKDIVIKKMVYLYLCNYAHNQPELAIMCINTLRRDCDNDDPMVRGLALRSLCGLRLESVLEYVEQPLNKSLTDISSYVRKTGVMGILKLNGLAPQMVENNGYLSKLYNMLQDVDANVVTNAIYVLNELQLSQGGIEVSQSVVMSLLNRIGEFSEWGLNTILELVARYKPSNEEEIFAIMNLLDPVLRTANSGAVLATLKCFLHLTAPLPDLHPQIYLRSKPPLLTLVAGSNPESQFAVLKHLELVLLQPGAKGIFDDEFRQFFVRYHEPPHVKHLKVKLLPMITNEGNARDVATELGEYVVDVDAQLAKQAIKSIGEIGMKIPAVSVEMTQTLLELIEMEAAYIRSQAVCVLTDLVRINPSIAAMVLPYLPKCLRKIEDPTARAALIWMLGEFGEHIPEAPYLLEPIIDSYAEEVSIDIKLQMFTAAMKLFFKRPPEMQKMLGRLLKSALSGDHTSASAHGATVAATATGGGNTSSGNSGSAQDLHDRALLYYRLLLTDVGAAKALFNNNKACAIVEPGGFAEYQDEESSRKIFSEFNTLAIIYGTPSVQFVKDEYQLKLENAPMSDFDVVVPSMLGHSNTATAGSSGDAGAPTVTSAAVNASTMPVVGSVNLLDWGEDDVPAAPSSGSAAAGGAGVTLVLSINPAIQIPPARFQQLWTSVPEAFNGRLCVLSRLPGSTGELEGTLRAANIVTVASGALPPNGPVPGGGLKLFIYGTEMLSVPVDDGLLGGLGGGSAQTGVGCTMLAQVLVKYQSMEVDVVVKIDMSSSTLPSNGNDSAAKLTLFMQQLVGSLSIYAPNT